MIFFVLNKGLDCSVYKHWYSVRHEELINKMRRARWDESKRSSSPKPFDFLCMLGRFILIPKIGPDYILQSLWWLHMSSRYLVGDFKLLLL